MSDKEHSDFGRILAFQSAPSMLGIKPANLINIDKNKFSVEDNIRLFRRERHTHLFAERV